MSALNVFDYDGAELRSVMIDGEPWFVLADVVSALGLARSASAVVDRLDDEVRQTHPITDRLGRSQRATVVSEAGVYEVVIRSDAAGARDFRRWLTHDVIPSIRRTGSYTIPETREQLLARAVLEANTAIAEAHQQIATLTPRAEAWDEIASAEGDYSVGDAAKMLARAGVETGPQRLFAQLDGLGWVFRGHDGKWRAYADKVSAGYLAERPQSHHHPRSGELVIDAPQVRITLRGLERLRVRLGVLTIAS
ncbi:phage antirepressor KilAC domain-containing protein [Microbacterium oleivorans]|uniref:phage antirepressor KilAC domain-containing protein n=1 Tax=Microbacterium oleivorans TaxID=273677 RepID=UPI00197C9958|nr:phage antirepressor KilAC domain-containing protein [Microbacterium oleivorans]